MKFDIGGGSMKICERSQHLVKITQNYQALWGPRWLRCCATNRKVAGSIPAGVTGFFIYIKSFRSHYGPGVDSASNRNEYQEHFLGGKGGRCVRVTTLPPSCAVVMKSGNLLGLSKPVTGLIYPFTQHFNLLAPELFFFLILAHLYIKCE
jgi:hypothetical protein